MSRSLKWPGYSRWHVADYRERFSVIPPSGSPVPLGVSLGAP